MHTATIKTVYGAGESIVMGNCCIIHLFAVCLISISNLTNFNRFGFPPVAKHIRENRRPRLARVALWAAELTLA